MPRKPLRAGDRTRLRLLLNKLKDEHPELAPVMGVLLPYLSPSKKRRPPEPDNLPMLAMLVQIAARDHGIRPTAILRRLQEAMIRIRQEKDPKWHPMVSARSVAGRQHGKLTDGEYLKRSMEELLPEELRRLGVDPSKFKLSLDEPEN